MYRVLAIDDDPSILRGYKSLFSAQSGSSIDLLLELDEEASSPSNEQFQLQVNLDVTGSGESGFEMVRRAVAEENPYAVIYLDMRMPGKWDGIATAREIRSVDQNVRIVVITAYTENLESLQEIIGNAFVYLKKPFMTEELLQMTRFLAEDWQLARELQCSVTDIVEANTAKSQFLSMISDEMRTPISTILGSGELLATHLKGQEGQEAQLLLQSIDSAAHKLRAIFNELRDAAQVQSKRIEFDRHPFDLSRLLNQLKGQFSAEAEAAGLEFSIDFSAPLEHYCVGSEERLQRVLSKLLENAVKFTEQGHVSLSVVGTEECNVSFIVEDSGVGIAPELIEVLATPFDQLDKWISSKYGDNGLGLYIAKELAQQMGGELEIESEPGNGTRVTLQLPMMRGETLRDSSPALTGEADSSPQPNKRILLVDDAIEFQMLVSRFLEEVGVEVVMASNGEEGVERALQGEFALILMDIRMPVMDGLSATRKLREQHNMTPVVMLAADQSEKVEKEAREAGAYGAIAKPVTKQALQNLVKLYC